MINSWDLRTDLVTQASPRGDTSVRLTHLPTGLVAEGVARWGESQLELKSHLIRQLEEQLREQLVRERVQANLARFGPALKRLEESEREEREAAEEDVAADEVDLDLPAPCFHCGKELEPAFSAYPSRQPFGAVTFTAYGQFGSTVFDPPQHRTTPRETLVINICDECLVEANREVPGTVRHLRHQPPVTPPPVVTAWVPDTQPDEAGGER